jgi:hypothetical protein
MKRATAMLAVTFLAAAGCKRAPEQGRGDAPPAVQSAVAGLCNAGGGKVTDAIAAKLLPAAIAGYCIDPNNEVRTYGKEGKGTIEQVCTELFDGECEVYRAYGLERVVSARYADGAGTPGTVTVNLSRFESGQSALGFFTRRIVGDADPATLTTEPFDAGTLGALGSGVAYLWRGVHVVELSYSNDNEAPDALKSSSKRILPLLGKAIGELLPGDREMPVAARLLPAEGQIKFGLVFEPRDVLGITGAGPGAFGFYRDGERRYRIMTLERANDQAAQDVIKTFRKVEGASEQKGPPATVTFGQRVASDGSKLEWVLGRAGRAVVAIGDDEHGAQGSAKGAERLSAAEKSTKLLALLGAVNKQLPAANSP